MSNEEIISNLKKSGFISALNIKITALEPGYCEGEMPLDEKTTNPYGTVHGGCIYSLADTIGGSAAITKSGAVVTLDSHMSFLNPAPNEGKLIAVGKEIRHGGKVAVYDVEIKTEADVLVAKATYTFYVK